MLWSSAMHTILRKQVPHVAAQQSAPSSVHEAPSDIVGLHRWCENRRRLRRDVDDFCSCCRRAQEMAETATHDLAVTSGPPPALVTCGGTLREASLGLPELRGWWTLASWAMSLALDTAVQTPPQCRQHPHSRPPVFDLLQLAVLVPRVHLWGLEQQRKTNPRR